MSHVQRVVVVVCTDKGDGKKALTQKTNSSMRHTNMTSSERPTWIMENVSRVNLSPLPHDTTNNTDISATATRDMNITFDVSAVFLPWIKPITRMPHNFYTRRRKVVTFSLESAFQLQPLVTFQPWLCIDRRTTAKGSYTTKKHKPVHVSYHRAHTKKFRTGN